MTENELRKIYPNIKTADIDKDSLGNVTGYWLPFVPLPANEYIVTFPKISGEVLRQDELPYAKATGFPDSSRPLGRLVFQTIVPVIIMAPGTAEHPPVRINGASVGKGFAIACTPSQISCPAPPNIPVNV